MDSAQGLEQLRVPLEKRLPACPTPAAGRGAEVPNDPPALDVPVLITMVGDDTQVWTEILGGYLVSIKELGDSINRAIDTDALSEVAALAHRLKSSSRSVGALELGAIAAELETAARGGEKDRVDRLFGPLEGALAAVEIEGQAWIDDRNVEAGDWTP